MKRRDFVKTSTLAAAGAATALAVGGAPAVAEGRRELTMIMTWPKGTPGVGVNAARFAEAVTTLTDGRLTIKLFGAGDLVPPFESLDAVMAGTADICHSTPYYWVGKQKALHYFTGTPFGLTAQELAAWIHFGGGQALWEEAYAPLGVQPFFAGSSGTQAGGWFRREINTPEDFQGLKFRIAGLGSEVLRRLGATAVALPPGEIAPALMSGAIDGADWIGPWNDLAFGLYRSAPYYYMPGVFEPGSGLEIVVNKAVYDSLGPDLQAAIRTAALATAHETLSDFTYHNVVSFKPLVNGHDVKLRRFNADIIKALAAESQAVLEDLAASDELAGKVHASFIAFLGQARRYAPQAEGGFLDARSVGG